MRAKIITGVGAAYLVLLVVTASLSQSVPELINYQGRLNDSAGQPLDGVTVELTFNFYGVESGATPLYLTVIQSNVLVSGGLYNVLIGSGTIAPGVESSLADVFKKHQDVWMGVKVNTDPEMTPRQRITSVPFALFVDPNTVLKSVWQDPDFDQDSFQSLLVGGSDCDDGDSSVFPGAVEIICDDTDQDCDGTDLKSNKIGSDIRVTNSADFCWFPSMSWTGSEFGMTWDDFRDGNYEIYFARVSAAGDTIGSDVRVTSDINGSELSSLAWTGTEFGMSWVDTRDGIHEIYFTRISASGVKVDVDHRISHSPGVSMTPSLDWTGSEYGVSWYDESDGNQEIYFARLASNGDTIGTNLRVTYATDDAYDPSLVWTGSEFGVGWFDYRDGNWEIYFTRISAAGATVGSDLRVTSDGSISGEASLAWTGSEFGVSWEDNRDGNWEIYFARIAADGTKIGLDLRVTNDAASSRFPSLSWTGSVFGISWEDDREGNWEIYFTQVSAERTKISTDIRITNDANDSRYMDLSWTSSEFGLNWSDNRTVPFEIYFTRIGVCP